MRVGVAIDGLDITGAVTVQSLTIQQDSTQAISTAAIELREGLVGKHYDSADSIYDDPETLYAWQVKEWSELQAWDIDSGEILFAGFVLTISEKIIGPEERRLGLNCSDYGILLERRVITQSWPDGTPDSTIFADALAVVPELSAGVLVTQVNGLGLIEAKDSRVRDLFDQVCQLTGGEYHVDYAGKLQYYRSGSIVAPFELTDTNTDGLTRVAFNLESNRHDMSQAANRIRVLGAVTADGEVTALAQNGASQAEYGLLSITLPNRAITDEAQAALYAESELAWRAWPQPTVTVTISGHDIKGPASLARGQTVKITSFKAGISASYIVRSIAIAIAGPEARYPQRSGHILKYTAVCGARLPDAVYELRRMQRVPVDTSKIPVATVPPGSINNGNLAEGLEAIQAVDALPALPDPAYSDTAVVFLKTDRKLYRRTGNTWTAYVSAAEIEGQLQTAQLAPGSVISTTLADGSVVSAKIPDGAIVGPKLAPLSVSTVNIKPFAVGSGELAAASVIAGKIGANAVEAGTIAANAVTANAIAAGAVTAEELAANSVVAGKIAADAVTAGTIAAGAVSANAIAANAIAAIHIQANAVETQHLIANAVTAGKIAALAVEAGKIAADAVTAGTIAAAAVNTRELAAGAVTAVTIAAGSVSSDKLNANEIGVGAGGGKPGVFNVYDGALAIVARVGTLSTGADYGGWFKVFGAGGSDYSSARIKSDIDGNVTIRNATFAVGDGFTGLETGPNVFDAPTGQYGMRIFDNSGNLATLATRGLFLQNVSAANTVKLAFSGSDPRALSSSLEFVDTRDSKGWTFAVSASGIGNQTGQIINSLGQFVGAGGVNTAGSVSAGAGGMRTLGQFQALAQAICVMNAAGNQYLGYIQADGSIYSTKGITLAGGIVCGGQAGLGDPATTGPFNVEVTTPTGTKSLWFMGGICYAVTG